MFLTVSSPDGQVLHQQLKLISGSVGQQVKEDRCGSWGGGRGWGPHATSALAPSTGCFAFPLLPSRQQLWEGRDNHTLKQPARHLLPL